MRKPITFPCFQCLAAVSLLGFAVLPAQADVSLQGRQTVRVGQAAPVSSAVILRYQGANTRLETAGEPTLVYDGKVNILYAISPAKRSYSLTVPAPADPAEEVSLAADEVKVETKLDMHGTGRSRILAGQTAHQYAVSGTVTFTRLHPPKIQAPNEQAEERERDARRRRIAAYLPPQWSIRGEVWLADTAKFPSGENTFLAAELTAVSAGPFQQPLMDALEKRSGLPLLSQMTVTHTPAVANAVPQTTQTTFTISSVSSVPLDGKLFKAPGEFALVAAPLTPYAPGLLAPASL